MKEKFEKYYPFPLKVDICGACMVLSASGERAFDFVREEDDGYASIDYDISDKEAQRVVDIVNGKIPIPAAKEIEETYYYEKSYIYNKKTRKPFLSIRGYGYLMGVEKLTAEEANAVQDAFGEYVTYRLNGWIPSSELPDGVYKGMQCGYVMKCEDGNTYYTEGFGIRGFGKTEITIKDGKIVREKY